MTHSHTTVHHLIGGVIGSAACGQSLGFPDQGGEVGGGLPPRTWDVHHVAKSAKELLAYVDRHGPVDACSDCCARSLEALQRRLRAASLRDAVPAWVLDADEFAARMASAWPGVDDASS